MVQCWEGERGSQAFSFQNWDENLIKKKYAFLTKCPRDRMGLKEVEVWEARHTPLAFLFVK